ncbi:MAG: hydrogenase expression/formation protein HypE [Candidatus Kentron sp. G]|nr:MAG: hydrogenase expression/formation protein HypE [Candidatus Kentron sp. G]VFN05039.1 MAG: hydrogenase expression/formation protein HypE [Candidatus Kentron sp. G]VFN06208.1 MAG: hydrogenase expression/formation protein HypE [Candidatus Kentron sp. G]
MAHEIRQGTGLGIRLEQSAIPMRGSVRTVCEILGYDPLYLACEGRAVIVVAPDEAERSLAICRAVEGGREAAIIGAVHNGTPQQATSQQVIVETEFGGERILEELEDDPLPRIC